MLDRANEFFISKREFFTLVTAIVAALAILFNNDAPQIAAVRSVMVESLAAVKGNMMWTSRLATSQQELTNLRIRATRLMLENSQLREAYLENHRLRRMLDYRQRVALDFQPARVIFKERESTPNAVIIDRGARDGLRLNMPVVTPDGLAGKIFKIDEHTSSVQLMLDHNFGVSARTQRSRVLGIVTWSATKGLELTGVSRNSDVIKGDLVVTSDYSALFPPGIRIGIVQKTSIEPTTLFMSIALDPAVDFSRLEEVFVVTTPDSVFKSELARNSSRGDQ